MLHSVEIFLVDQFYCFEVVCFSYNMMGGVALVSFDKEFGGWVLCDF